MDGLHTKWILNRACSGLMVMEEEGMVVDFQECVQALLRCFSDS